jgi:hypothetical protein
MHSRRGKVPVRSHHGGAARGSASAIAESIRRHGKYPSGKALQAFWVRYCFF